MWLIDYKYDYSGLVVPNAVENSAILKNPQQFVLSGDIVEISSFLVSKEQIGFPDGIQHGGI